MPFSSVLYWVLLLHVISWNPRNQNAINKHTQNTASLTESIIEVSLYDLLNLNSKI